MSEIGNAHLVIRVMRGDMGLSENVVVSNVITIRKPRKGSKEARDIVAMIGREHHKYLLSMLKIWVTLDDEIEAVSNRKADYWRTRKAGKFSLQSLSFILFQNAKSMLGASNE